MASKNRKLLREGKKLHFFIAKLLIKIVNLKPRVVITIKREKRPFKLAA